MLELYMWRLLQSPLTWTSEQADQVKLYFQNHRPQIPSALASGLWSYWNHRLPNQPLFEQAEDNVALLLHAKAYGESVPGPDDNSVFGKILHKHRDLFEESLVPPQLAWGSRAILAKEVLVCLDSTVLHAWVFMQGNTPQQILIIGEGLPGIRDVVLQAAFMTSLRVHGVANDIMNVGILRVELPGTQVTPLTLPNIIGNRKGPLTGNSIITAEQALRELHGQLQKIQQDTGLVRVHQVEMALQNSLSEILRTYAFEATADRITAWAPGAVSRNRKDEQAEVDVVTATPYWQIPADRGILRLGLSSDLIRLPSYERLLQAYQYKTIERLLMDLRVRRDEYQHEFEYLEAKKREYERATHKERLAIWGPTVLLNHKFDFELGARFELAEPEEKNIELYFKENVPRLIENYRLWHQRVADIEIGIRNTIGRPDAPIHRFAASRFLDAAARNRTPDESPIALSAYQEWCTQIQPVVWFEWRCLLRKQGIRPESVFTSHTFFHTWLTRTEDGKEVESLVVAPFSLFDQRRSVALFDTEHRVTRIYDGTDYAKSFSANAETRDQLWQRLMGISEQSSHEEDELWEHLMMLSEQSDTTKEQFVEEFRNVLRKAPTSMMARVLYALIENRSMISEEETADSEQRRLEAELGAAEQLIAVRQGMRRAIRSTNVQAFQTARECLDALESYREWAARVYLLRAITECDAEGIQFQKELPAIFNNPHLMTSSRVKSALHLAKEADEKYAKDWIARLEELKPATAERLLQQGLPLARDVCTPDQFAALLTRQAAEAARLARELEEAVDTLEEDRETIDAALAKLGLALEHAYLSEFASVPEDELFDLIAVLTGKELPRLRGSQR